MHAPKVAAIRYRGHALSATPVGLRSSVDDDFHSGVIALLPAVTGSVQNYEAIIPRVGSTL